MARTPLADAADLSAAEVIHARFTALPAGVTVGEVRAWFGESSHRRMAFLADGDRYAGSIPREALDGVDDRRPAREIAHHGPTVAPEAPAREGYELAVLTDANRVPVVDSEGRLLGVVGVTEDRAAFCGTASRA
ncbi:MAG TPA: CBS domain-containing protein [Solirubrobacteraceae bacterium]|nr:CBS domain-containing protein [Solirubrobacteraceae bacterium]